MGTPTPPLTDEQQAILVATIGNQDLDEHLPDVPQPPDPAALALARADVTKTAHQQRLHGFGAFGAVFGLRLEVDWRWVAPNPLNPREDLIGDPNLEMRQLINSLKGPFGQVEDVKVTPLLPDDPLVARGYRWIIVKGSRTLRAFQIIRRKNPLRIVELLNHDGLPLSPFEQMAYYTIMTGCKKPLTMPELVRLFSTLALTFEQEASGQQLRLPDVATLQQNFGVSRPTIYRALGIVNEPTSIRRAVVERRIPAQVAIELPQHVADADRREALIDRVIQINAERTSRDEPRLTVRQMLESMGLDIGKGHVGARPSTSNALPAPAPDSIVEGQVIAEGGLWVHLANMPHIQLLGHFARPATAGQRLAALLLDALDTCQELSLDELARYPMLRQLLSELDQENLRQELERTFSL